LPTPIGRFDYRFRFNGERKIGHAIRIDAQQTVEHNRPATELGISGKWPWIGPTEAYGRSDQQNTPP
jgi:hypothetical protein